jgi:hypothetical protein
MIILFYIYINWIILMLLISKMGFIKWNFNINIVIIFDELTDRTVIMKKIIIHCFNYFKYSYKWIFYDKIR